MMSLEELIQYCFPSPKLNAQTNAPNQAVFKKSEDEQDIKLINHTKCATETLEAVLVAHMTWFPPDFSPISTDF